MTDIVWTSIFDLSQGSWLVDPL